VLRRLNYTYRVVQKIQAIADFDSKLVTNNPQGNVATHRQCSGMFNEDLIKIVLLSRKVKEFRESVGI